MDNNENKMNENVVENSLPTMVRLDNSLEEEATGAVASEMPVMTPVITNTEAVSSPMPTIVPLPEESNTEVQSLPEITVPLSIESSQPEMVALPSVESVQPEVVTPPSVDAGTLPENSTSTSNTIDVQPRTVSATSANFGFDEKKEEETKNVAGALSGTNAVNKVEKEEVQYKPLSKIKVIGVIFLFILLIGFVVFLPDVDTFISRIINGDTTYEVEKITTGNLVCTYTDTTKNTTIEYTYIFGFSNNKLQSLRYEVVSKVDASEDSKTMDTLVTNCKLLKQTAQPLSGISIRC